MHQNNVVPNICRINRMDAVEVTRLLHLLRLDTVHKIQIDLIIMEIAIRPIIQTQLIQLIVQKEIIVTVIANKVMTMNFNARDLKDLVLYTSMMKISVDGRVPSEQPYG